MSKDGKSLLWFTCGLRNDRVGERRLWRTQRKEDRLYAVLVNLFHATVPVNM